MPCPHYDLKIVGGGHKYSSAVSSSAYQSGEKLYSEREQVTRYYPKRSERIIHTEIMLPDNAPPEYMSRERLWNSAEMNEPQRNAQYARRFVMALPRELSYEDNLELVRQYCQEQFVSKGMCVDLAYHYDDSDNPHVHILTTMRAIDEQGRWMPKSRKEYILDENGERIRLPSGEWKSRKVPTTDWDNKGNLEKWRHAWEVKQNWFLEQAGRPERVDMRSFERQQNDLVPTVHLGPEASAMERRGIRTFLGDMNREIRKHNALITFVKKGLKMVRGWIDEISNEKALREEMLQARGPSVHQMLVDYFDARNNEREGWASMARIKGMSRDLVFVKEMETWCENHGIYYASDLIDKVAELEARSRAASDTISRNDTRRKTIARIKEKAAIYAETKPVFDKYSRMFFKPLKDGFAKDHETELTDHKRAYGYLMKNHGGKLEVTPNEFDSEMRRMKQEDAAATADLESIKGQLTEMKKLKRKLEKSTPELAREDRSLREQLTRAPERTPERNTPRKPTTQKKHDQAR